MTSGLFPVSIVLLFLQGELYLDYRFVLTHWFQFNLHLLRLNSIGVFTIQWLSFESVLFSTVEIPYRYLCFEYKFSIVLFGFYLVPVSWFVGFSYLV